MLLAVLFFQWRRKAKNQFTEFHFKSAQVILMNVQKYKKYWWLENNRRFILVGGGGWTPREVIDVQSQTISRRTKIRSFWIKTTFCHHVSTVDWNIINYKRCSLSHPMNFLLLAGIICMIRWFYSQKGKTSALIMYLINLGQKKTANCF